MSLAAEIVAALPAMMAEHPRGPRAMDAAKHVAAPYTAALKAFDAIKAEGLAIVVRYPGLKARHVVPIGHDFGENGRACAYCDLLFFVPKKSDKRRCCCRACGIAWSWTKPGVAERRCVGIRAERETPKAKERLAAHNQRRWAKPEEREKLGEQSRARWADPVQRAKLSASIQAVNGSPEGRARQSRIKKEAWKDPAYRESHVAAVRAHHGKPESRAKFSKLLRERWQDPILREKYLKATRANARIAAEVNRGKRQTPEHIAKRTKKRREDA